MQFRRIDNLPPYVFAHVNELTRTKRRAGEDVVDLGFGNPDIPSPENVVEKLAEAARNTRNHRYSASRGIPNLRKAVADLYRRQFHVELDPETEVIQTIGAKEGLSHLMWVLLQPGDVCLVPEPSYPIHFYAPLLTGASVQAVRLPNATDPAGGGAFFDALLDTYVHTRPRPRVIITSFPHNPTTACVEMEFFEKLVAFAREHEVLLVHDFAYADLVFDGYRAPSLLQVPGAKDIGVELYTLSKSFSMAGWRVAFMVGNADVVAALARLKSYLDYGTFQPIQIASIIALNEAKDYPEQVADVYRRRRDALCDGLARIGWDVPRPAGTMFVWAPIPETHRHMGSLDFSLHLVEEAKVAVAPGIGFGPSADAFVRFALVENELRIGQAVRSLRNVLAG